MTTQQNNIYFLLTFNTPHTAIKVKKLLEPKLNFFTVPVLREISANCGISLKMDNDNYKIFEKLLNENFIDKTIINIYEIIECNNINTKITKIL